MFSIDHLPNNPGCYLFKDKKENIIYIGKAKNLKKRVKSYIQKPPVDGKTHLLINNITSVDFIVTDTENEALVLENNLIKKYQPKYNIDLKDAKGYAYLRLTNDQFPRLVISRWKKEKGKFFGPFVSAQERDYILQFIQRTFHVRSCKKLPKRACLRYHINLCDAPCINMISEKDYNQNIKNVKLVLKGHINKTVKNLKSEMKKQAESQKYEQSLQIRNQINALKHLQERQNMQREKKYDEDIINYSVFDDKVYLIMFNVYKGTLINKQEYVFDNTPDVIEEFLILYYYENNIPKELILPKKISTSLVSFLKQLKEGRVHVTVPKKGVKKQLLNLVKKNIEITFFASEEKITSLQMKLKLNERPSIIECFDISHLSGTSMVGSMVQFRNGKPDKNNYRRFKIRTVEEIDDVAAIDEIVRRRYKRLKNEETEMPNLIIIDGGKGQLNRALKTLSDLNVSIPVISIAKKFEEIYLPGRITPVRLNKKDKALHFVQEIRNEAHRFAIKYNRLLRKKELIG
jgi:excinuclease ABC subunit C